jgi:hypothetical protein
MSQWIFGPITDDSVVLFTLLSDGWYYLKPDSKSGKPLYFSKANTTDGYYPLKLESGSLVNSDGNGFVQSSTYDCGVISTNSNGSFDYVYSDNVTKGTGLVYGVNFSMVVDGQAITFFYKTNDSDENYSGIVRDYFLVPINAYNESDCLRYSNGAFLAYSNATGYAKVWYSVERWCNVGYKFKPCLNGEVCGDCYGPCDKDICEPISDGVMECRTFIEDAWYQQLWFYLLIGIIIAIAIILIVYFTLIAKPSKTKSVDKRKQS